MNNPQISIAVPVYNSEKYLAKCIDSILSQTYDNLEIILLNNGSTDRSYEIICEYEKLDSRVKSYTIEHVPTETWSRNNAYLKTTSEWIIPVDSDDQIEPTYVEKLWKRHQETGAEWVGATMTLIDQNGVICGRIPKDNFDYSQIIKGKDAVILTLNGWKINGNGALIHRTLVPCIASGEPQPLYNVEYDMRIILYYAKMVAFVDAKYYFGYNPNSFGRKRSYSKLTYVLHSYVGLLSFINHNYPHKSKEVGVMTNLAVREIIYSFIKYWKNRDLFSKENTVLYYEMIQKLNDNISYSQIDYPCWKKFIVIVGIKSNILLLKIFS